MIKLINDKKYFKIDLLTIIVLIAIVLSVVISISLLILLDYSRNDHVNFFITMGTLCIAAFSIIYPIYSNNRSYHISNLEKNYLIINKLNLNNQEIFLQNIGFCHVEQYNILKVMLEENSLLKGVKKTFLPRNGIHKIAFDNLDWDNFGDEIKLNCKIEVFCRGSVIIYEISQAMSKNKENEYVRNIDGECKINKELLYQLSITSN